MIRTTSILNYYSLTGTNTGYGNNLVIRPPQNLKVFRATIYADNRETPTTGSNVIISNAEIIDNLQGISLTSIYQTSSNVPIPPATSTGQVISNIHFIVLDRRGEGYMVDDFFITGKGGVSIIWEGIQE